MAQLRDDEFRNDHRNHAIERLRSWSELPVIVISVRESQEEKVAALDAGAEYRLLEAMATNPGKLLTHSWLLQKVWGPGYGTESNYLRLYVRQIRQKLGDMPSSPHWITIEPGLGYRWLREPAPAALKPPVD